MTSRSSASARRFLHECRTGTPSVGGLADGPERSLSALGRASVRSVLVPCAAVVDGTHRAVHLVRARSPRPRPASWCGRCRTDARSTVATARSTCWPLRMLCSVTTMWQLQATIPEPPSRRAGRGRPSTPGTSVIACSRAAMSRPLGTASSRTLTASVRMPHELQRISPPIRSETIGSAIAAPVAGHDDAGRDDAQRRRPRRRACGCRRCGCSGRAWPRRCSQRLMTPFSDDGDQRHDDHRPGRDRPAATQPLRPPPRRCSSAMTTSETALTRAARMPTRW